MGDGADFTNVGAIEILIASASQRDLDMPLDSIVTAVPEPGALTLLAVGGVALSFRRRMRRA